MSGWSYIDLYSGAGGVSCGFSLAGASPLLGVDSDATVLQRWAQNVAAPPEAVLCATIGTDPIPLPSARRRLHYHASSPCQSFSHARTATSKVDREEGLRLFRPALETALRTNKDTYALL